jgi:hypothetical protein
VRSRRGGFALVAVLATGIFLTADAAPESGTVTSAQPGNQGRGVVLLPNGWKIAPAGRHIPIGDLPLAMLETPDGR